MSGKRVVLVVVLFILAIGGLFAIAASPSVLAEPCTSTASGCVLDSITPTPTPTSTP